MSMSEDETTRRDLLKLLVAAALTTTPGARVMSAATAPRQPVGHGSPMNAIEENRWAQGFRELARLLPRPRAILAISAHWYGAGTRVTATPRPETIHDFGGFPDELYKVQYPAPGDPALAERVVKLLAPVHAATSLDWGLDHGTWSVLVHLRPGADLPVLQLSLDARLAPEDHLAIGRHLAPLRDEGVLIMGSGNVTHNLRHAFGAMQTGETATPPWAQAFDAGVARAFEQRDHAWLTTALASEEGRRSHPSPDHFLPLLYVAGASAPEDQVRFPITGFDLASLSMRSILMG
jgi:4,5-DOPA dioxygenase extradiol